MAMSKKDFIALADVIKRKTFHVESTGVDLIDFTRDQIETLADFCQSQNPNFNRERWLGYIEGTNGPSGGAVK